MGLFRLVARVGCLSGGAIRRLEEWSPNPARGEQNPAYRPSGVLVEGLRHRPAPPPDHPQETGVGWSGGERAGAAKNQGAALALVTIAAYLRWVMARSTRSTDWGFPRWRGYGASREAQQVRLCDRHGCEEPGDRPAPKSPNSRERWYFCETHAA